MNSKKNLVEKPKAVAKPKATKKNLVEKLKAVAKPKPVKKATKKDLVEKLNKKRIWKGGNAEADEIIGILKDIKYEYSQFLFHNIDATKIENNDKFVIFVLHFFKKPNIYSIIDYELITTQNITYLSNNLEKFGITSNYDNKNKFIKLIGLFNIIRAIYNMKMALNIGDFVDKMNDYKNDDKHSYNTLEYYINSVWSIKNSISRANFSTDNQQSHSSVSSKASSYSFNPSLYATSSNYRPDSRLLSEASL